MPIIRLPLRGQIYGCGHRGEDGLLVWLACDATACERTSPIAGSEDTAVSWAEARGWTVDGVRALCPVDSGTIPRFAGDGVTDDTAGIQARANRGWWG